MENKEHVYKAGDIVNIYGGFDLWYGDGKVADMNGRLWYPNSDERAVMKPATEEEADGYFTQVNYNGLKWNPKDNCFEPKDPNSVKYHHGDKLVNRKTLESILIIGICRYEGELTYLFNYGCGYKHESVDKIEELYFSETEVNTIPKRKYRIVKVSDKNKLRDDAYYIQERKFGFLWLYVDPEYDTFLMKYTCTKFDAEYYYTLESAAKQILRLRIEECYDKRIGRKKRKPNYHKDIMPVGSINLTTFN